MTNTNDETRGMAQRITRKRAVETLGRFLISHYGENVKRRSMVELTLALSEVTQPGEQHGYLDALIENNDDADPKGWDWDRLSRDAILFARRHV